MNQLEQLLREHKIASISSVFNNAVQHTFLRKQGKRFGVKTGYKILDLFLSNEISYGSNIIIGGLSGSGKSSFSLNLLKNIIEHHPTDRAIEQLIYIYWNFEMSNENQVYRLASMIGNESFFRIKYGYASEHIMRVLSDKFANYKLFFIDTPKTIDEIEVIIKMFMNYDNDYRIINIFDHSRLFKQETTDETGEMTQFYNRLKWLSKEYKCINFVLSQLNKAYEQEVQKKFRLPSAHNDLFGASAANQLADVILMISDPNRYHATINKYPVIPLLLKDPTNYKKTYETEIDIRKKMIIKIDKNREGLPGALVFDVDFSTHVFNEIDYLDPRVQESIFLTFIPKT
jgi:replicative DNA helicase